MPDDSEHGVCCRVGRLVGATQRLIGDEEKHEARDLVPVDERCDGGRDDVR
jgi:hypothetical protein